MPRAICCLVNSISAPLVPSYQYADGGMIAIDTIAVENGMVDNMYECSARDRLIYNAPAE